MSFHDFGCFYSNSLILRFFILPDFTQKYKLFRHKFRKPVPPWLPQIALKVPPTTKISPLPPPPTHSETKTSAGFQRSPMLPRCRTNDGNAVIRVLRVRTPARSARWEKGVMRGSASEARRISRAEPGRSEEHTSELQSRFGISYA